MVRQVLFLVLALALILCCASAQFTETERPVSVFSPLPFIGQSSALPDGHSARFSFSVPPFTNGNIYPYGSINVGIEGLVGFSYSHEAALGSPLGLLRPTNLVSFRVQVVPQRRQYPAVSLFLTTMTELQAERLGDNDLSVGLPVYFGRGLTMVSYEAKTTRAGVGLNSTLGDLVNLDVSFGVRENVWRQMWSIYTVDLGYSRNPADGSTAPMEQQSKLGVDWSVSFAYRPITQLAVLASAATLPFADVDPTTLTIQMRPGNMGTLGVRYYLPFAMCVDLYDRWYLEPSTWPTTHEIRLGLSAELAVR